MSLTALQTLYGRTKRSSRRRKSAPKPLRIEREKKVKERRQHKPRKADTCPSRAFADWTSARALAVTLGHEARRMRGSQVVALLLPDGRSEKLVMEVVSKQTFDLYLGQHDEAFRFDFTGAGKDAAAAYMVDWVKSQALSAAATPV